MSEREQAMRDFLGRSGWGDAVVTPLPGDASTRRYARLANGSHRALLMDQPQTAEAPTAPEDASAQERRALGYNAVARLAGASVARFAAVARHLKNSGLSAPEVYAADNALGFMILEDLGDGLFADVVAQGGDEKPLYTNAMEVLAAIHRQAAPSFLPPPIFAGPSGLPLFAYDETALLAEVDLLTEWYIPYALGRAATADEIEEHRVLWRAALAPVLAMPPVLVHRDYHAQNLFWLPERDSLARTGLIDFQDAVAGSKAYDLVSLIEDARRDVPPEIAAAATRHYLNAMRAQGTPLDEEQFRAEMAVMAAQRNAKIVGIFARLYRRDGKPRYLSYLPRVWAHLERDLAHPSLAPLRAWYDRTIPRDIRTTRTEETEKS